MCHDIDNRVDLGRAAACDEREPITRVFVGTHGLGGDISSALSTFANVDGAPDGQLELVAGNTVRQADGTELRFRGDLPNGFPGVGDFDKNEKPDVMLGGSAKGWLLNGTDGTTALGPMVLTGNGTANGRRLRR